MTDPFKELTTEVRGVEKRLDDMLNSSLRWRAGMTARQVKVEHALFGNGDAGIDEQIRNIHTWIEEQKKWAERRRQWWDKLQWVIIPVVFVAVMGFIGQAIVFYFKILPMLQDLP